MNYAEFLDRKAQLGTDDGFEPEWMPDFLYDFQRDLVAWALRKGRAAIFADCGLGKTPMQLVWAENVRRHTGRPVLILTPLAVAPQTIIEAGRFGIEATISREGEARGLTVTNYERLHKFDPHDFAGCVCDESSAIKSFDGSRRTLVTQFMRKLPYRLLCTATAAPNDYIELGTSSEALGHLGHHDMLQRFFKNDQGNAVRTNRNWTGAKWRLKGHAEEHFWRWVCSWARAIRRPSDLGYDDARFVLPALVEREHVVPVPPREDLLFDLPAVGLWEERQELRRTVHQRCEAAAALVNDTGQTAVVWCHLNAEGRLLARLIPDAVEISGADTDDAKESAFVGFARGDIRVLVTKPKIGAWGLNWQHCAHMSFFPSHSFESYYQAVRRCWRFGQTQPVRVDIVTTPSGSGVQANLSRKASQADQMFSRLVAHMNAAMSLSRSTDFPNPMEVPSWLSTPSPSPTASRSTTATASK